MDNVRGAVLMVAAMAGFAVEDAILKTVTAALPIGQVIATLGLGGAAVFALWMQLRGGLRHTAWTHPLVLLRTACEALGTVCFVTALNRVGISTSSAILQATPLVAAPLAAWWLGQAIGPRRWAAILIGLLGVLLILRPGLEGFRSEALFAVIAMTMLALRDVITRALGPAVPGPLLSVHAFAGLVPAGLLLLLLTSTAPVAPDAGQWGLLAAAVVIGVVAYVFIVGATRIGDVAVISPFRYTRLPFALLIGIAVFQERPDAPTLIGAGVVVASGVYAFWREARAARAAGAIQPSLPLKDTA
ncbi:MAG: DMT family transporter [Paracoccaceae bacterium]